MKESTVSPQPLDRSGSWSVETPKPSDRGLVARLLEDVVASDPTVAPEVASKELRPAQWLQKDKPVWSGIVLEASSEVRKILGYASVTAGPDGRGKVGTVLVSPSVTDPHLESLLRAAAESVIPEVVEEPQPVLNGDGLAVDPPTFLPTPPPTRRGRGILGGALIAGVGILAVLAVSVGYGPLGEGLPFVTPGQAAPATVSEGEIDETIEIEPVAVEDFTVIPTPTPLEPLDASISPVPGVSSGGVGTVSPDGQGPSSPSSPEPEEPGLLPETPEAPASGLVRPLAKDLDETLGTDLSPLVKEVEGVEKDLTKTVKDVTKEVEALIPPLPLQPLR